MIQLKEETKSIFNFKLFTMQRSILLLLFFATLFIKNAKAQDVYIPDSIFLEIALYTIDTNKDGKIQVSEAEKVTHLELRGKNINDLTGIEAFVNLDTLLVATNNLTVLDVSKNKKLKFLNCAVNKLTVLDISSNLELGTLACYENDLTSLDLSKVDSLVELLCSKNNLKEIDLSKNIKLQFLSVAANSIEAIDLSNNLQLVALDCSSNGLTDLDVSKHINLQMLACNKNQLEFLDLSNNKNIEYLYCMNMPSLKSICVSDVGFANTYYYKDTSAIWIDECVMGINHIQKKQDINIFPNPAKDIVYLEENSSWEVFDVYDKLIKSGFGSQLDLTNQSSGVYIIRITRKNGLASSQRLVKE